MFTFKDAQIKNILDIAEKAGSSIMEVRGSDDFEVKIKHDNSPLTEADQASHDIIEAGLNELFPEILIVSEEDKASHQKAHSSELFWLIDPLDGTKEFIKGGSDFTVNIALVKDGIPVFGVIYVPVTKTFYWNDETTSYKKVGDKTIEIQTSNSTKVKKAVASKSHFDETTEKFLNQFGEIDFVQAGSSLKICLVAEGESEVYPRFAPTMEWDTAAGDAIARKAGAKMLDLDGNKLIYLKENLFNPGFICIAPNIKFDL